MTQIELNERLARLALYMANLNHTSFHRVLQYLGSASEAFSGPSKDLSKLAWNLQPLLISGLLEEANSELEKAQKLGVQIIIYGDSNYPIRLMEIPEPPPVIWLLGTYEETDSMGIAIVGSRQASQEGLHLSKELSFQGGKAGLTIISGLAKGIDTQAHLGALESGGRTIAVLGSSVDWVYPKENKRLFEIIPKNGALISEYPLGTRPIPAYFPRRNRLISGLSLAVVVVEAKERSGALITARIALEHNRELMAMPGPAGSAHHKGSNELIKNGAALVESIADVLIEIKPRLLENLAPIKPKVCSEEIAKINSKTKAPTPDLPEGPEKIIYEALVGSSKSADELIETLGLNPEDVAQILLELELESLIKKTLSGQYEINVGSENE